MFYVAFAQSFLVCAVLYMYIEYYFNSKLVPFYYLLLILLLFTFSSLPFISNLIMSDIFTSIFIISLAALLYFKLSNFAKISLIILSIIAISTHNSHTPIALIFTTLNIPLLVISEKYKIKKALKKIALILLLIIISSYIIKPLVDGIYHNNESTVSNDKRPSDSKFHFIWYYMYDTDLYSQFLNKYCPSKSYQILCNKKEIQKLVKKGITNEFHSDKNIKFLSEIEDFGKSVVKDPVFFGKFVILRFSGVIKLISNYKIRQQDRKFDKRGETEVEKYIKKDAKYFHIKKSVFYLCYQCFFRKNFSDIFLISISLIFGILSNYLLMGIFANIDNSRYSSRVNWIIIFIFILIFFSIIDKKTFRLNKTEELSSG